MIHDNHMGLDIAYLPLLRLFTVAALHDKLVQFVPLVLGQLILGNGAHLGTNDTSSKGVLH